MRSASRPGTPGPEVAAHFCGVKSSEELRGLTDLSAQASGIGWRSLCQRRMENDFLQETGERAVYDRFLPFIRAYRKNANDEPLVDLPPMRTVRYRL